MRERLVGILGRVVTAETRLREMGWVDPKANQSRKEALDEVRQAKAALKLAIKEA